MISEKDRGKIIELSRQYGATKVILFGSATSPEREYQDIDIGIEGIAAKDYFRFYGELMFSISKPVDIIDISRDSKFTRLVRAEGIVLYG